MSFSPDSPRYLAKSTFAKALGITRQSVGEACGLGGPLAEAFSGEGRAGRIDTLHPAAAAYAAKQEASHFSEAIEEALAALPDRFQAAARARL